jgi:hypothetical protein
MIAFTKKERGERAVCKRCGMVMDDREPTSPTAEFWHKKTHRDGTQSRCANAGETFYFDFRDGDAMGFFTRVGGRAREDATDEVEWFMRKSTRRAMKRATR